MHLEPFSSLSSFDRSTENELLSRYKYFSKIYQVYRLNVILLLTNDEEEKVSTVSIHVLSSFQCRLVKNEY